MPFMNMQAIKDLVKRSFLGIVYRRRRNAKRKLELENHLASLNAVKPEKLSDTSFDIFTYHGEDGIIAYLLGHLRDVPPVFVDIGAGDCIIGNCSSLIVHDGWEGVFFDKDCRKLAVGKKFYKEELAKGVNLRFVEGEITPGNINELLLKTGIKKDIGLLSVDIDGNDYWIWKAVEVISPRIVVIESKVEFGLHDVIVPYGNHNHRSVDTMYSGASAKAFVKLAKRKGYRLAGANKQGYNLFFVREDEPIKSESTEVALSSESAVRSFYPESFFNEHKFVTE